VLKKQRILCVIPARGGSVGLPRKNLREIHGVSLVGWAVKFANLIKEIDVVAVSSDSDEILNVSKVQGGACIEILRPEELSGPRVSDTDVLRHALEFTERQYMEKFDIVVMLQPTSPLRQITEVNECIYKVKAGASAAWTISEVDLKYHFRKQLIITPAGNLDYAVHGETVIARQQLNPTYIRNGACYVVSKETLLSGVDLLGPNCGLVVSIGIRPNIDTLEDFEEAHLNSFVENGRLMPSTLR